MPTPSQNSYSDYRANGWNSSDYGVRGSSWNNYGARSHGDSRDRYRSLSPNRRITDRGHYRSLSPGRRRSHSVQNVKTVVGRNWQDLKPREGVSEEHVKVLQPLQKQTQVIQRTVYEERSINTDVVLEKQVGVPREVQKPVDNIIEKEVIREVPVYIEKEIIKYEDRVVTQQVERIKEIPVEVEKIVYVDKPVYQEVIVDVPKPIYVDRVIYKDRVVEKEVLTEVHVEVEQEKISYVNQLVERTVKEIIEVPIEEIRYEDRITTKQVDDIVYKDRPVPTTQVREVPKYIDVPKVRYVDKPVEKVVYVDRNKYVDKIIEVEKTNYVDVPVYIDNPIEEVVEKIIEVPVEVVSYQDRVVEVPVERVVYKDNHQTVVKERVIEKVVDKVVPREVPGRLVSKNWDLEIQNARDEYRRLQSELERLQYAQPVYQESRKCGIGVLLERTTHAQYAQDNYIYVLELVPGGPAALCGNIMTNDILYKVDGTDVSRMDLNQVSGLVRGDEGTPITLEFGRQGGKYRITLHRQGVDYQEMRAGRYNSDSQYYPTRHSQSPSRSRVSYVSPSRAPRGSTTYGY